MFIPSKLSKRTNFPTKGHRYRGEHRKKIRIVLEKMQFDEDERRFGEERKDFRPQINADERRFGEEKKNFRPQKNADICEFGKMVRV